MAPGHWYVNILAAYREFRGRGVATALLAHADALGRAANAKGMAIIVASENDRAVTLYDKLGYRQIATRPLRPFPGYKRGGDWLLFTKPFAA